MSNDGRRRGITRGMWMPSDVVADGVDFSSLYSVPQMMRRRAHTRGFDRDPSAFNRRREFRRGGTPTPQVNERYRLFSSVNARPLLHGSKEKPPDVWAA